MGFTSGAFDILHAGHVDYLEKAGESCDFLIAGLNSDESVRLYKGENRPVIPQDERAEIVAALEAVDFVFIFNERRNKTNIEELKPDLYIKAGDYSDEKLTSKEIVEKHGGKALLIPVTRKTSTSDIVSRIGSGHKVVEEENTVRFEQVSSKKSPVVFFDRDGTINTDAGYVHEPDKFIFLETAIEGMKKLSDMEYRLALVTNQPGIGIGYYTKEDLFSVNKKMLKELSANGIMIEKIYFCGHSKSLNCKCRKPEPGLLQRGIEDLQASPENSYMIGDRTTDIEAGKRAGLKTILVRTGAGGGDNEYDTQPDYTADNLMDAANYILDNERKGTDK